ncbi:GH12952 [Drosophila grimshawi]|uniref:GH12952 n=1 Tax=Drosophila grimshawi TaxID=7222 RepID=B4K126_DROGR|nr:GH12952 [Drosophila grimshawi]
MTRSGAGKEEGHGERQQPPPFTEASHMPSEVITTSTAGMKPAIVHALGVMPEASLRSPGCSCHQSTPHGYRPSPLCQQVAKPTGIGWHQGCQYRVKTSTRGWGVEVFQCQRKRAL